MLVSLVLKKNLNHFLLYHQKYSYKILSTVIQINQTNKLNKHKFDYNININNKVKLYSTNSIKNDDHSNLWKIERILSATLIGIIPGSFMFPLPLMNYLLALSLVIHVHWGIEAILIDYIRPEIFGKIIPKLFIALSYIISIFTLAGIFYFNYIDIGLIKAIKMFVSK